MKRMFTLAVLAALAAGCGATAQDAPAVIEAATQAMGTSNVQSIQYSGSGSVFMLGQNVRPEAPWPKFTVPKYSAAVRYDAPAFREELVRIDTEDPPRGGGAGGYSATTGQGGMRPIIGEQSQVRQGTPATDNGFLQVWMTPHGFLKAAAENKATLSNEGEQRTLSFQGRGKYTVTGRLNAENLVERIETHVDNPMLGDMLVEAEYSGYQDYNGIKFPTHIVERSGGQPTLDVTIDSVQPNGAGTLEVRPNPPGEGGTTTSEKLGDGVWVVTSGLNSLLVEFADYVVVVEALGNDARSQAVIAEVKRLVPSKPIRYLVNTHAHFDHSGGVRAFAAEGATIVTQDVNKPFMEKVLSLPHQLNPDNLAKSGRTGMVEGFSDKRVFTDGTQTLELHHVQGNNHHDGLLIAYVPKLKLIVQADAFHPRPGAKWQYPSPPQFTVNLVENVKRLNLDVARVLHIHGGIDPYAVVAKAAVRSAQS